MLDAFNDKNQHVPSDKYRTSKLLDLLLARQIASLPAAAKVTVNSANPGLCASQLSRELPLPVRLLACVHSLLQVMI